jgi:hypothetical protein
LNASILCSTRPFDATGKPAFLPLTAKPPVGFLLRNNDRMDINAPASMPLSYGSRDSTRLPSDFSSRTAFQCIRQSVPATKRNVAIMTIAIDVCVCTYRRASLADTLRSVRTQNLPTGASVRVIVSDNDETPSAREVACFARVFAPER